MARRNKAGSSCSGPPLRALNCAPSAPAQNKNSTSSHWLSGPNSTYVARAPNGIYRKDVTPTPELSTGRYQDIYQSSKPWAGANADKDYTKFKQLIDIGNGLLENGLYGVRLNAADLGVAGNFNPQFNDPTATVVTKLKGAIGFFNYANAKAYSQQTGVPSPDLNTFLSQSGYSNNQ